MLIALHKPYGVLSQFTSEPGSAWATLTDFQLPKRVYPVGRLDADSEGLLLLSDEKSLVQELLLPSRAHPRTYWAQVEGQPNSMALQTLALGGLLIQGKPTRPAKAKLISSPNWPDRIPPIRDRANIPTAWIELTLTEGRNRQVRRMTAAVGHPTLRLLRVAIGKFELKNLTSGSWRILERDERALVLSL
ncbi:MAG: pseudouridine synthase [Verrucomicrobiales bacterium]